MNTHFTPPIKNCISFLLIFLVLFQTVGCRSFFELEKMASDDTPGINNYIEMHKHFIVHERENIYSLTEISLDSEKISGNLELTIDTITLFKYENHPHYFDGREFHYKKAEKNILNEIHIYLKEDAKKLQLGFSDIPLSDISEIRIIEKDTKRTRKSYILGGLGITAGVVAVFFVIALLASQNTHFHLSGDY